MLVFYTLASHWPVYHFSNDQFEKTGVAPYLPRYISDSQVRIGSETASRGRNQSSAPSVLLWSTPVFRLSNWCPYGCSILYYMKHFSDGYPPQL